MVPPQIPIHLYVEGVPAHRGLILDSPLRRGGIIGVRCPALKHFDTCGVFFYFALYDQRPLVQEVMPAANKKAGDNRENERRREKHAEHQKQWKDHPTGADLMWCSPAGAVQCTSKHIMNCFQHIPESCGALHNPCGGAPQQRGPLTPQTQTRPYRLHTYTHPPKRLAYPRLPIPPLSKLTSRATHAHPTSPRSNGFCAIWDCISSSSSSQIS